MKATELAIGDLVLHDGSPMRVYGIMERMNRVYDTMTNDISLQYLSPIPLTVEILEKNGIKFQFGEVWYQIHEDKIQIACRDERLCIDYVHQLQHLLRLCRLSDLADNFKI